MVSHELMAHFQVSLGSPLPTIPCCVAAASSWPCSLHPKPPAAPKSCQRNLRQGTRPWNLLL